MPKYENLLSELFRKAANLVGLEVTRLSKAPRYTLLGMRCEQIRTVVDVGANRGQFAKYVRGIFPNAHLYCFEPLLEPYLELQKWAACQQNVKLFRMAMGDTEGTAEIFRHVEHDSSSSLLVTTKLSEVMYSFTQKQKSVSISISTLDVALESAIQTLVPEILIKLDVQGYEEQVINGGQRLFEQAKACIVEVSLDQLYIGQANFKRLLLMLERLGFRYAGNLEQNYGNDGHVIFLDALFVR